MQAHRLLFILAPFALLAAAAFAAADDSAPTSPEPDGVPLSLTVEDAVLRTDEHDCPHRTTSGRSR